jgi:hypothetical protein
MINPETFWSLMSINGRELDRTIDQMSEEDIETMLSDIEAEKKERGYL